jgi:hypothetical protein
MTAARRSSGVTRGSARLDERVLPPETLFFGYPNVRGYNNKVF